MLKERLDRDRFIEENLGLVHSLCRRFAAEGALVRHRALESYGLNRTQTR